MFNDNLGPGEALVSAPSYLSIAPGSCAWVRSPHNRTMMVWRVDWGRPAHEWRVTYLPQSWIGSWGYNLFTKWYRYAIHKETICYNTTCLFPGDRHYSTMIYLLSFRSNFRSRAYAVHYCFTSDYKTVILWFQSHIWYLTYLKVNLPKRLRKQWLI